MEEIISTEVFNELVQTGRIGLSAAEAESLRGELNRQMRVIRQLEAIPLNEHIEPLIHGNPYPEAIRCPLREDIPQTFDAPAEILSRVPASDGQYIISPDIFHRKIG